MHTPHNTDPHITTETMGAGVVITLNRPEALNALTGGMIRSIRGVLAACRDDKRVKALVFKGAGERAFCAGGDIKAVYHAGAGVTDPVQKAALARTYFADEYHMNRELFSYPKPIVAMMDGITMGGGFGVAGPCRYRVATQKTVFAMPETGIGFFPDVGSMYALTRVPDGMGHWLALSGESIDGAAMRALGLASHGMSSAQVGPCIAHICDNANDVGAVLEQMQDTQTFENETIRIVMKIVRRAFQHDTVETILKALDENRDPTAQRISATIRGRSPTSVKLAHAYYLKMKDCSFDAVTAMDYRLSIRCVLGHDFYEGIRAALIDKDKTPRWQPAQLEGVSDASIEAYFYPDLPDLDSI